MGVGLVEERRAWNQDCSSARYQGEAEPDMDVRSIPPVAQPFDCHCRLATKGCNQASGPRDAIFA